MQFFILILLFCFFIFLFSLHRLSKDDFIFIRKGISIDNVFNAAFATAFVSLIFARVFYIYSFPEPIFSTFLGSVLFPYFPGLSLVGCVYGGAVFLLLYCLYRKLPLGRVFDFFTMSLLYTFPIGFLFVYFVSGKSISILISLIFYIFFLLLNTFVLMPLSGQGRIREGGVGLIFVAIFSLFTIIINAWVNHLKIVLTPENLILFPGLIISLSLFIYNQFLKIRRF